MYKIRIEAPVQRLAYPKIVAQKDDHQSMYSFVIDLFRYPVTSCDFAELLFQQTKFDWKWKVQERTGHRLFYTFIDNFNDSDDPIVFFLDLDWLPDKNDFVSEWKEDPSIHN